MAQSKDPQASAIELLNSDPAFPWDGGPDGEFEAKHLFGLLYSIEKSIKSMVTFGKFLNELVADVQNGNVQALFKAVQIDRTITSCSPIADRISRAEILREDDFFKKLSNALTTKPMKPKEEYRELRYILYALEEVDALDTLPTERAYQLFCNELAIYPSVGSDPARNLEKFIYRWKKARET